MEGIRNLRFCEFRQLILIEFIMDVGFFFFFFNKYYI